MVCSMTEQEVPAQVEEVHHRLLRLIEQRPELTQREAADALGVSVGKVNYCLKALVDRGYVKLGNFRRNPNKVRTYGYLLTPAGIEAKTRMTVGFLKRKLREYEQLEREIALLRSEVDAELAADVAEELR